MTASALRDKVARFQDDALASGFPFGLLCFFTAFTFLNISNRIDALAVIRPTVILIGLLFIVILAQGAVVRQRLAVPGARWIVRLLSYIALSLPFVEFPGSILHKNFEVFAKSAIFFLVVLAFVDSEKRLDTFVKLFVGCTIFRCLEPLYMHLTSGYWGEMTYFSGGAEGMERLAGAPADIIGANGLAFVAVSALPFLHYWATCRGAGWMRKLIYAGVGPLLLYVLVLTASRSGMLAGVIVIVSLIYTSKRKGVWVALIIAAIAFSIPRLDVNQVDRYSSIYDSNAKQAGTAQGRVSGWVSNIEVWSKRPIFGFGLGTSQEANFNIAGEVHYAHNLYLETMIELGIIGFFILVGYLWSVWRTTQLVVRAVKDVGDNLPDANILLWLPKALLVWSLMCAFFSILSYGLSEYQWYLVGGLSMVCYRLLQFRIQAMAQAAKTPEDLAAVGLKKPRPGARPPGVSPEAWGRPKRRGRWIPVTPPQATPPATPSSSSQGS